MLTFLTLLHQRKCFLSGRLQLFGNNSPLSDNIVPRSQMFYTNLISTIFFRSSISESLATFCCHRRENQSGHKFSASMACFKCGAPGMSRRDGELEYCCSCCCPRWETQLVLLAASPALPSAYCDCPTPPSATYLAL